jgi:predicted short-subunit dehydrogenase-like oxidoreductase (DUF2520 family)
VGALAQHVGRGDGAVVAQHQQREQLLGQRFGDREPAR